MGSSGRSVTADSLGAARTQAPCNLAPECEKHLNGVFSSTVVGELVFTLVRDYAELNQEHSTAARLQQHSARLSHCVPAPLSRKSTMKQCACCIIAASQVC